jgi:hypothetical protein
MNSRKSCARMPVLRSRRTHRYWPWCRGKYGSRVGVTVTVWITVLVSVGGAVVVGVPVSVVGATVVAVAVSVADGMTVTVSVSAGGASVTMVMPPPLGT